MDNCNDDIACLSMTSTDRLGLEAIRSLHQQLDDDANGNIDLTESDDVRPISPFKIIWLARMHFFFPPNDTAVPLIGLELVQF